MNLKEFVRKNLARKAQPDRQLINSLFNTSKSDLKYLKLINLLIKKYPEIKK